MQDSKTTVRPHKLGWNEPVTPSETVAVWNAHRPLRGAHQWEGDGRWGVHYAAEDIDSPRFAEVAEYNRQMDARRIELVDNAALYGVLSDHLAARGNVVQDYVEAMGSVARGVAAGMNMLGLPWHGDDTSADHLLATLDEPAPEV